MPVALYNLRAVRVRSPLPRGEGQGEGQTGNRLRASWRPWCSTDRTEPNGTERFPAYGVPASSGQTGKRDKTVRFSRLVPFTGRDRTIRTASPLPRGEGQGEGQTSAGLRVSWRSLCSTHRTQPNASGPANQTPLDVFVRFTKIVQFGHAVPSTCDSSAFTRTKARFPALRLFAPFAVQPRRTQPNATERHSTFDVRPSTLTVL
jgi:hypothetical protein